MNVTIDKAARGDVDVVVGMVRSFYEEFAYPFDVAVVYAAVDVLLADRSKGVVWIAKSGGEAVGYAVLTYGFSIEYGGADAFVDEIWLARERRGSGLGEELLTLMDTECRKNGVRALHLEVERSNSPAKRLYRTWGFEDIDRMLMTRRWD